MLTGAPNLSQLALEVGYVEGTYLSRKFKQVVGISPAAYHRKNKRIVALNFNHTASLRALEIMPQLGVYSGGWNVMRRFLLRLSFSSKAAARPCSITGLPLCAGCHHQL